MIKPKKLVYRASLCVGLVAAVFGLLAVLLPTSSEAQPPPPPPPDCATKASGFQRNVSSQQQDADAGNQFTHGFTYYGYDDVVEYDTAHPEEIRQRSIVENGIYNELVDYEGGSATTVNSTFTMKSQAVMAVADGQPAPDLTSFAQHNFRQPVYVAGDEPFLNFNSAWLETALEGGEVTSNGGAFLFIEQDGGSTVHISNIESHDVIGTFPDTGATARNITVPLEPGSVYIVGVLVGSEIRALGPGPARGFNHMDLFVDWSVGCPALEPLAPSAPDAAQLDRRGRLTPG